MIKKKTKLSIAQDKTLSTIDEVNAKIDILGSKTNQIYNELKIIEKLFEDIRNIPCEERTKYEKLRKIRLNWKQQAEKIELDYKNNIAKNTVKGVAGVSTGVAVVTLAPTAAMGIATTFGVASTGTAISTLSGAAATNAALAWLGGGALATGGGGMAAGSALIALTGPVGWAIAGVAILGSGFFAWRGKSEKKRLENIFTLISKRDIKSYKLAIVEMNERINRIVDECSKLNFASERIRTFGLDYSLMSEEQQYELGSYVNLMNASTQLLVNPITGLQPKYSLENLNAYLAYSKIDVSKKQKLLIVSLSNLLYNIDLDEKDKSILCKFIRGNKEFLSSIEISKKDLDFSLFNMVTESIKYKLDSENK